MDYALLMYSQLIAFMTVVTGVVILHAYINVRRKEEFEIAYDESEEDERISQVRLHKRHDG